MLIVDTGPLVATADRDDPDHVACDALLGSSGPLVTTGLVIAEAAYLIAGRVGVAGEAALLNDIANGQIVIETLERDEWTRVRELLETYADLGLGTTDATVITLAERHKATQVATLDHRHFHVVRPSHTPGFVLLP